MSLIQPLPPGPLDIVGDIHGELAPLQSLLGHLGYDAHGHHPQGRTLVFVGDFVDRGPNSPGVVALVAQLVAAGRACAIVGNHEINLMRQDAKDGSGWFFRVRRTSDHYKYGDTVRTDDAAERQRILAFLRTLPLALERDDLRVVHAAWHSPDIARVRTLPAGQVREAYDHWENAATQAAVASALDERLQRERLQWPYSLEDGQHRPPFLQAHCDNELNKALFNPLKVLTCGLEQQTAAPFFAGNKWRFVERVAWWDQYTEATPVVVGHYWRSTLPHQSTQEGLFAQVPPAAWHGLRGNVLCVDYSVGARAQARTHGQPTAHLQLAALRWPERQLMFDDGRQVATTGFLQAAPAR